MTNFDGPIEAHKDQCGLPKELPQGEWTNGEINAKADDGTWTHINGCPSPHYWAGRFPAGGLPAL